MLPMFVRRGARSELRAFTAHGIFAVIAVAFGLGHGLGVGNYLGLFWKGVIWTGIAVAALWLLIYVRLIKPWFMLKKPYLVETVVSQRGDVWNLVLRPRGHSLRSNSKLSIQNSKFKTP
jgi:predicted ferric reductase